jgi:hypothetical protein
MNNQGKQEVYDKTNRSHDSLPGMRVKASISGFTQVFELLLSFFSVGVPFIMLSYLYIYGDILDEKLSKIIRSGFFFGTIMFILPYLFTGFFQETPFFLHGVTSILFLLLFAFFITPQIENTYQVAQTKYWTLITYYLISFMVSWLFTSNLTWSSAVVDYWKWFPLVLAFTTIFLLQRLRNEKS